MRNNQLVLEQESQLNAPDPREINPPCYDDAINMPKPLSFLSLKFGSSELNSSIRRATKRSRSEEQLDMDPLNKNQRLILSAKSRKSRIQNWITNTTNSEASVSGLVKKKSTIVVNDKKQNSFEVIKQLETEDGHSPYSQRKPQPINEIVEQIQSSVESLNEPIYANGAYVDGPIYANEVSIAAQRYYRGGVNTNNIETPHTSQSLDASYSSFTSSSSSSVESDNDYFLRLSHYQHQISKQSDV